MSREEGSRRCGSLLWEGEGEGGGQRARLTVLGEEALLEGRIVSFLVACACAQPRAAAACVSRHG